MKNLFRKFLTAIIGVLTIGLASGTALSKPPVITPDVNTTWRVHVSTIKANVTFYSVSSYNAGAGIFTRLNATISDYIYNLISYFGREVSLFIEALQITDTSWSGPAASYMITRAVVGADTIEKGCIYIEDNIRKKKTIPRIEVSGFMQKRQSTPTSQGSVVVDGQVINPQDLMLYYEFNPRDLEVHFYAEQLAPKLLGRELPVTFENYMCMQTMKRLNEFFENAIHRSRFQYDPTGLDVNPTTKGETQDADNYYYFDGLIKKLLDASTAVTNPTIVVPGAVALTTANIRDQMTAAINLLPNALIGKYGKGGVKFCMSYKDWLTYGESLRTDAYKNVDSTQRAPFDYRGYDIEILAGLPSGTFYLGMQKPDIDSNTWLGLNSTEDNQLQLQRLQNNSELYFIKGLFKMDTQVGFPDQFVLYTTITD